jgi:hypothetical protein
MGKHLFLMKWVGIPRLLMDSFWEAGEAQTEKQRIEDY